VNGRRYAWPDRAVIVVCIDGSERDYFERALETGTMPYIASIRSQGTYRIADSVIPTFTNPNNLSIVTGAPPSVHAMDGSVPSALASSCRLPIRMSSTTERSGRSPRCTSTAEFVTQCGRAPRAFPVSTSSWIEPRAAGASSYPKTG